tara:strand:+ start:53 stop:397 length:345 start_codon:yes stop_codon:yes gene_type:complete
MVRLIDDKEATVARLCELYGRNAFGEDRFNQCIEDLYATIPEWHDKLDPDDEETWVLCFVSDGSPEDRDEIVWIYSHDPESGYPFNVATTRGRGQECYEYATPVDLNIRYKGKV